MAAGAASLKNPVNQGEGRGDWKGNSHTSTKGIFMTWEELEQLAQTTAPKVLDAIRTTKTMGRAELEAAVNEVDLIGLAQDIRAFELAEEPAQEQEPPAEAATDGDAKREPVPAPSGGVLGANAARFRS